MKKTFTMPIPSHSKVEVKSGEKITPDTLLYSHSFAKINSQEIPVAQLLRIKAAQILKYLTKSMGQTITEGEVIAVKKSLFAKDYVRSPIAGIMATVDLKKGTILITANRSSQGAYRIPVAALVKEISSTTIDLEIDGVVIKGDKGEGKDCVAKLCQIEGNHVSALDIQDDVEDTIIMGRNLAEDALVKCEVLQTAGCVSMSSLAGKTRLPWVQFDEPEYRQLSSHNGEKSWLIPSASTLVVL